MDLNALMASNLGLNLDLLEDQYAIYQQNPENISDEWRSAFDQLEKEEKARSQQHSFPTTLDSPDKPALAPEVLSGCSILYYPRVEISSSDKDWRILNLINAYRTYGYLLANIHPIEMHPIQEPYQLDLAFLGFSKQDLAAYFPTHQILPAPTAPLLDILNALRSTYCDKMGIEYMEISKPEVKKWLQEHLEEKPLRQILTIKQKQSILDLLNKSELFESFLHTKYVGQKRFSLEGGETLIPMLAEIVDKGASLGIEECILGMPHRGRLNVLCNIFDKSYSDIFSEFEEGYIPASVEGSGDVKYHKGFYSEVKTLHEHQIKLTLSPNPSHLEAVDPIVEGQVRARQTLLMNQMKVLPILIHGDAAISGQGVIYETLQLSSLKGYSTAGTIHIVINNQIGFTTLPKDYCSTSHCTDIGRIFNSPIFHLNAEDPESCVYAATLAVELRNKFHCDVFLELNCYRKYGHNETDEPAFTQPLAYQRIRKKQPIRDIYSDLLIHQGVMEKHLAEALEIDFKKALDESLKSKKTFSKEHESTDEAPQMKSDAIFQSVQTGVSKNVLQEVGERICHVPQGFNLHPKLAVLNKERLSMLKDEEQSLSINWSMGELLAYGTLLWEGRHVRLAGQDSCRGTFSHRHALFIDQSNEKEFIPLKHLKESQGRFDIYNSPLSELAALGFEYGYSVAYLDALVIWEAQFGDFCNGAQVVIDQFIACAEQKWNQKSRLVLFLPHGYEGQGPEHSSGRIERFLSLAGDYNMQIAYPTTPAQFFHLLRRQLLREIKKPLVVFTPKSLLRHPACISHLEEFTKGEFQEILDDPSPPKKVSRLVLCSGHIFYDIIERRDKFAKDDMSIVRIEQLYPLHVQRLKEFIEKYRAMKELIWVQEEPSNMGAWNFIRPILKGLLPNEIQPFYIGRSRSASTAVGSHALHKKEHAALMKALFEPNKQAMLNSTSELKV